MNVRGLTLDEALDCFRSRGVERVTLNGDDVTFVAFFPPFSALPGADPTESNPERDDAVAASAIALAGRTRRQTAGEP